VLRAIDLISDRESLPLLDRRSASSSRCSKTRNGGSFPWSSICLICGQSASCCRVSLSRVRRLGGTVFSTTFACEEPLDDSQYDRPFPLTYEEVLDEELNRVLAAVHVHIDERDLRKPFLLVEDEEVTQEDKDFICRTMQLDPRDRPSADELLADRWFGLP
jgi:hypothetical protein